MPMEKKLKFVIDLLDWLANFGAKIVNDVVVKMVLNALPKIYEYYV